MRILHERYIYFTAAVNGTCVLHKVGLSISSGSNTSRKGRRIVLPMSRKYPLSYPAAKTGSHKQINEEVPRDYYSIVFRSSFMGGPFRKISGHGTLPIIIGAAVAATGHSQMLVRAVAVLVCSIWLSLDVGVWISGTQWPKQRKCMVYCVSSCLLGCSFMGITYWFLESKLEDQQKETFEKLTADVTIPTDSNVMHSMFSIRNGGSSKLEPPDVSCHIVRLIADNPLFVENDAWYAPRSNNTPLSPNGDGESIPCLANRQIPYPAIIYCADVALYVDYALQDQPLVKNERVFRWFGYREAGQFVWYTEALSLKDSHCRPSTRQPPP